jgi:hypothetical protein
MPAVKLVMFVQCQHCHSHLLLKHWLLAHGYSLLLPPTNIVIHRRHNIEDEYIEWYM